MAKLSKFKKLGERFLSFLFSYQGTINRTQYFLGFILINLFALIFYHVSSLGILVIVEFIYLYVLFALVQKRCRDINRNASWIIVALSVSIVSVMIYNQLFLESNVLIKPFIIGMIILAALTHLYLMMTAGSEENKGDYEYSSFLLSQPLVLPILLQLFIAFGVVLGSFLFARSSFLFSASTIIYANKYSYLSVCQKHGYGLVYYPQKFADFYSDEIGKVEKKLNVYGFSLSELFSKNKIDRLDYRAENELDGWRRKLILDKIAARKHLSRDTLEWRDEYDNQMTLFDVCRYIDHHADDVIQGNYHIVEIFEKAIQ